MEFATPTTATLIHVNMRAERHGEEQKDAYDVDMKIKGANTDLLERLAPGLCAAFYWNPDAAAGAQSLPGVVPSLPSLRFGKLATTFAWVDKLEGADLSIMYGTGRSNIVLKDGTRFQVKKVELEEGGSVSLFVQFQTSNMPDGALDKLRKKLQQEITFTCVACETTRQQGQGAAAAPAQQQLDDGGAPAVTPESALADAVGKGQAS